MSGFKIGLPCLRRVPLKPGALLGRVDRVAVAAPKPRPMDTTGRAPASSVILSSTPSPVQVAGFLKWCLGLVGIRPGSSVLSALPPSPANGVERYGGGEVGATELVSPSPNARPPELVDIVRFHSPVAANVRLTGAGAIRFEILRANGGDNGVDDLKIMFANPTVSSRRHARVSYDPDKNVLIVADLGSTNGTGVTVGSQPVVRLRDDSQVFDTRGTGIVVIRCGDTAVSLFLHSTQPTAVRPADRRGALRPTVVPPALPQFDPRQAVMDMARLFPQGVRADYIPHRQAGFTVKFQDAAGNSVQVRTADDKMSMPVISAIARRMGIHLGNMGTVLPVSIIMEMSDVSEFGTQRVFRGINGQMRYNVEDGGIVTISQVGGNTMTSMNFSANEWGVASLLNPETLTGRQIPAGVVMTVYMLTPTSVQAAEGKMDFVVRAIQNSLRPLLKSSTHPLLEGFMDVLR